MDVILKRVDQKTVMTTIIVRFSQFTALERVYFIQILLISILLYNFFLQNIRAKLHNIVWTHLFLKGWEVWKMAK